MPDPVVIEPVPFRAGKPPRSKSAAPLKWMLILGLCILFAGLAAIAYAIFTFKSINIATHPLADRVALSGDAFHFRTGDTWWMQPGDYQITAEKTGYKTASVDIEITPETERLIEITLEKKPGTLRVRTTPTQSTVQVTGQAGVVDSNKGIVLEAGDYEVKIEAPRYIATLTNVTINGLGATQEMAVALAPGWGEVSINSIPPANLSIDGVASNATPTTVQLLDGAHSLSLSAEGFTTFTTQVVARAGVPMDLGTITLLPAKGRIRVSSAPTGAQITIDGTFAGQSPNVIEASPDQAHEVTVLKAGYEPQTKSIIVSPGKEVKLDFTLKPQEGEVRFVVNPPDAELLIDGKSYGKVPERVSLVAVPHRIELRHPDFKSHTASVNPRPKFPQELKVDLIPIHTVVTDPEEANKPATTEGGYPFVLVQPGPFQMGSSRREQGRRSNETLRNIELQRPFYLGAREVTNKEFREFRPEHNSGAIQTVSLNRDEQPVVNVTWEDAARYCIWLSEKEGITPAYRDLGGKIIPNDAPGKAYRLPTEAEWEYSARSTGKSGELLKYPWGDGFPPKEKSGNYGDQSASDFVVNPIPEYADGYPGSAPVGSFPANRLGLYDMNGNVSEWTHDAYKIYPYSPTKAYVDPLGPEEQTGLWVIRGASYKSSTITNLRYCYRNYADEKKADVGFRICRYVD